MIPSKNKKVHILKFIRGCLRLSILWFGGLVCLCRFYNEGALLNDYGVIAFFLTLVDWPIERAISSMEGAKNAQENKELRDKATALEDRLRCRTIPKEDFDLIVEFLIKAQRANCGEVSILYGGSGGEVEYLGAQIISVFSKAGYTTRTNGLIGGGGERSGVKIYTADPPTGDFDSALRRLLVSVEEPGYDLPTFGQIGEYAKNTQLQVVIYGKR